MYEVEAGGRLDETDHSGEESEAVPANSLIVYIHENIIEKPIHALSQSPEMLERRLQEPEATRRVLEEQVRFVVQQ